MIELGKPYDANTYNCVDFAWGVFADSGVEVPDISHCRTSPGFFRILRKHWQPAIWPPEENDLVVMTSLGRWHIGVWKSGKVWHCEGQAQATDYGTIKAMYNRVEFYRHVPEQN